MAWEVDGFAYNDILNGLGRPPDEDENTGNELNSQIQRPEKLYGS